MMSGLLGAVTSFLISLCYFIFLLIILALLIIVIMDLLIRYKKKNNSNNNTTPHSITTSVHTHNEQIPLQMAILKHFMVDSSPLAMKILHHAQKDFLLAKDRSHDDPTNGQFDPRRDKWLNKYGTRFQTALSELLLRIENPVLQNQLDDTINPQDELLGGRDINLLTKIQNLGFLTSDSTLKAMQNQSLEYHIKDPILLASLQRLVEFIVGEYVIKYYTLIKADPDPAIGHHIRRSLEHVIVNLVNALGSVDPTHFFIDDILVKTLTPILSLIDGQIAVWKERNQYRIGSGKKRGEVTLEDQFLELFQQIQDPKNTAVWNTLHPAATAKFQHLSLGSNSSLELMKETAAFTAHDPQHDYTFKWLVVILSRTMREEDYSHPLIRTAVLDIASEMGLSNVLSFLEPFAVRQLVAPFITTLQTVDDSSSSYAEQQATAATGGASSPDQTLSPTLATVRDGRQQSSDDKQRITKALSTADQQFKDRIPRESGVTDSTIRLLTNHNALRQKRTDWKKYNDQEQSKLKRTKLDLIANLQGLIHRMVKVKKQKQKQRRVQLFTRLETQAKDVTALHQLHQESNLLCQTLQLENDQRGLEIQEHKKKHTILEQQIIDGQIKASQQYSDLIEENQQLKSLLHEIQQGSSLYGSQSQLPTPKSQGNVVIITQPISSSSIPIDSPTPSITATSTPISSPVLSAHSSHVQNESTVVGETDKGNFTLDKTVEDNNGRLSASNGNTTQKMNDVSITVPPSPLVSPTASLSTVDSQLPSQQPIISTTHSHTLDLPSLPFPPSSDLLPSNNSNYNDSEDGFSLGATPTIVPSLASPPHSLAPLNQPPTSNQPTSITPLIQPLPTSHSNNSLAAANDINDSNNNNHNNIKPRQLTTAQHSQPSSRALGNNTASTPVLNPTSLSSLSFATLPEEDSRDVQLRNVKYSLTDIDALHEKDPEDFILTPSLIAITQHNMNILSKHHLYPRVMSPHDWQLIVNILTSSMDFALVHVNGAVPLFDSHSKAFSGFDICITVGKFRWAIRRRFSNLLTLQHALKSEYGKEYDLTIHNRRLMNFFDGAKAAQERCQDTETYLNDLLKRTPFLAHPVTRWYFQPILHHEMKPKYHFRFDFTGIKCILGSYDRFAFPIHLNNNHHNPMKPIISGNNSPSTLSRNLDVDPYSYNTYNDSAFFEPSVSHHIDSENRIENSLKIESSLLPFDTHNGHHTLSFHGESTPLFHPSNEGTPTPNDSNQHNMTNFDCTATPPIAAGSQSGSFLARNNSNLFLHNNKSNLDASPAQLVASISNQPQLDSFINIPPLLESIPTVTLQTFSDTKLASMLQEQTGDAQHKHISPTDLIKNTLPSSHNPQQQQQQQQQQHSQQLRYLHQSSQNISGVYTPPTQFSPFDPRKRSSSIFLTPSDVNTLSKEDNNLDLDEGPIKGFFQEDDDAILQLNQSMVLSSMVSPNSVPIQSTRAHNSNQVNINTNSKPSSRHRQLELLKAGIVEQDNILFVGDGSSNGPKKAYIAITKQDLEDAIKEDSVSSHIDTNLLNNEGHYAAELGIEPPSTTHGSISQHKGILKRLKKNRNNTIGSENLDSQLLSSKSNFGESSLTKEHSTLTQSIIKDENDVVDTFRSSYLTQAPIIARNLSRVYPFFAQTNRFVPLDGIIDVHITDQMRLLMLFYNLSNTMYNRIQHSVDAAIDSIIDRDDDLQHRQAITEAQQGKEIDQIKLFIETGKTLPQDIIESTPPLTEPVESTFSTPPASINDPETRRALGLDQIQTKKDGEGEFPHAESNYESITHYIKNVIPNFFTWPHSTSLHCIFDQLVQKYIPPLPELNTSVVLLNFVDRLFDLHENSFMRRRLVWMIKVLVQFTGTGTLDSTIQDACSPQAMAGHIDLLVQILCGYRSPQQPDVDPAQFLQLFSQFISHYGGSAFGIPSCETAALKLALLLQSPALLHHVIYSALDTSLTKMFPDIIPEIKYIHSSDPIAPIVSTTETTPMSKKLYHPQELTKPTRELLGLINPQVVQSMKYNSLGITGSQLKGDDDEMAQTLQHPSPFSENLDAFLSSDNPEIDHTSPSLPSTEDTSVFREFTNLLLQPLGYQYTEQNTKSKMD